MSRHPLTLKGMPTMFGEVIQKNVVFCVDTSGSMYHGLDVVKEHLIETLLKHSRKKQPTMFNIIEFNSEVTQWADKMVRCTPETVTVASKWINELGAKTGTNTQDALLTAFMDPCCEGVYLVTDGLPDKHPGDIIDHVTYASKQRPIHCIYLATESSIDSGAVDFLEDLAVETYGSLHIVTLTTHGFVERITPIYRSDYAGEKVIRTINGTLHTDPKACSVTTTLQVDPDESLFLTPRVSLMGNFPEYQPPWWPPNQHWLNNPYRYYYPYWWTRYRPAKTWLNTHKEMVDWMESPDLSPAAGSLLIGKLVLARRIDDGYFYRGTVKSQILSNKFLIAFGPCKHGKFQDTEYQDTYVYDILGYEDAKRHTIQTGDKVLASWEPEGERWGPGVVIDGYEKRQSEGPTDQEITVTFSNGRTERVPLDTAVWIPPPLYERLGLELKMPQIARESLQDSGRYPSESLPGYPTSGPDLPDFQAPAPLEFNKDPLFIKPMPWPYRQPYVPAYPVMYKHKESPTKSVVKSEDINALIPGTNMTRKDLDDKVMSQIMEHKLLLEDRQDELHRNNSYRDDRLLRKREKQELNQFKKSVTFEDDTFDRERMRVDGFPTEDKNGVEIRDRYYGQQNGHSDLRQADYEEEIARRAQKQRQLKEDHEGREHYDRARMEFSRGHEDNRQWQEEAMFDNDRSRMESVERLDHNMQLHNNEGRQELPYTEYDREMAYIERNRKKMNYQYPHEAEDVARYREQGRATSPEPYVMRRCKGPQPRWKTHWKTEPIPPLSNSQPFRETALQAPLEARNQKSNPSIVEWNSPMYKYVDHLAKHDCFDSVGKLMKTPKPPEIAKAHIQWSDQKIPRPMTEDEKQDSRLEYKRRKVVERDAEHTIKVLQQDLKEEYRQDQHRQRVLDQINRDRERQARETEAVRQSQDARKMISTEIQSKIEANQKREQEKDTQRIEALRIKREEREITEMHNKKEAIQREEIRQQAKMQRSQNRWEEVPKKLDQEETQMKANLEKAQTAKLNRIEHYEKLEKVGQMRKDLRLNVTDGSMAMYRSQVLP